MDKATAIWEHGGRSSVGDPAGPGNRFVHRGESVFPAKKLGRRLIQPMD